MLKKISIKYENLQKGFTLLFSTLVASLVLMIALAIANISLQQFSLSSAARESQLAFYLADTGIDCAQYYDRKSPGGFQFPTNEDTNGYPDTYPDNTLNCGQYTNQQGQTFNLTSAAPVITPRGEFGTTTSIYRINSSLNNETCNPDRPSFEIEVNKRKVNTDVYNTEIRARGYNTCDVNNPRRVERGLLIRY
jgi:type II secretory pathway pseudopilin PulG